MRQPTTGFSTSKTSSPHVGIAGHERPPAGAEASQTQPLDASAPGPAELVDQLEHCLNVLKLWLQWESCHESLTELMYRQRSQGSRIEVLLDECERLRFQASEASKRLVEARDHAG
jgi:hypothetical protein